MLNCIGRDIEHRKLELQMNDDNVWELLSDSLHEENRGKNRLALAVLQLMQDENELIMTPSELAERLNVTGLCSDDVLTNRVVTRRLMEIQLSLSSLGIGFRNYLSNGKRLVKVWRQSDDGDDTAGHASPHPNTVAFVTADTSSNLTPAFPL